MQQVEWLCQLRPVTDNVFLAGQRAKIDIELTRLNMADTRYIEGTMPKISMALELRLTSLK